MPVRGRPTMNSGARIGAGGDLGMPRARVDHVQAVLQQAHDIGARDDAPEHASARASRLADVEQDAQRRAEPVVAEVVEPGRAQCARQQRLLVEPQQRHADRAQRPADGD